MIPVTVAIVALTTLLPAAAPAAEDDSGEVARGGSQTVAPLQAREVIERLKTMRAQLLLEQEYNRILEARLERQELEAKLGVQTKDGKDNKPKVELPRMPLRRPPQLDTSAEQITVKAVTVAPFKEAIVTYRGRVYTVRPGDKLGDIVVRDINESGVVTSGGGSRTAVMLGQ
ncbi:MAG: hypothetical protein ACOX6T_04005 [Myxococcales bacterium]